MEVVSSVAHSAITSVINYSKSWSFQVSINSLTERAILSFNASCCHDRVLLCSSYERPTGSLIGLVPLRLTPFPHHTAKRLDRALVRAPRPVHRQHSPHRTVHIAGLSDRTAGVTAWASRVSPSISRCRGIRPLQELIVSGRRAQSYGAPGDSGDLLTIKRDTYRIPDRLVGICASPRRGPGLQGRDTAQWCSIVVVRCPNEHMADFATVSYN